ncbi:HNH endonuclease signature motif containing protein [Arthrobacter parietis]|uniref:HNH endonuclease signature motif containing protein n=1 Tax=Arthrobacter parietis TaxID=271434 RepID=A0ABN3AMR2_9MICC
MAGKRSGWVSEETALWASDSVMGPLAGQLSHHPVTKRDLVASLECVEELATLRAWVDAQEAKLLTHIAELTVGSLMEDGYGTLVAQEYGESLAAAEIGPVLRIPDASAGKLIEQSKLLVNFFPATVEALQLGKISRRHALTVAQESCGVPEQEIPDFEEQLLEIARGTTVAKLSNRARRLRELMHPEALTVRREKKIRERSVAVDPASDGMAWLSAYLPAEEAYGIMHRIDGTARTLNGPDEPRTLGQLRADIFSDLLTHTCATDPTTTTANRQPALGSGSSSGPSAGASSVPFPGSSAGSSGGSSSDGYRGVAARVFVTVPVMTLLGGNEPAELDGYGPIDPDTARKLAGHAPSFTRLLTHPESGAVLSVGRTRYKPPKDLQDWVRVRDKTCRHPGCNRTAVRCEIDHTTPWSQGGETCADNLGAFCKRHHLFKTMGFWKHRQPVEGTIVSTSLTGRTYTTHPEPIHAQAQAPPF